MKRIFLAAFFIIAIRFISFGQSGETEPNNSFSTASPLAMNDYTTANLGGGDTVDYHGVDFSYNANFYLVLEITNTGSSGTQTLNFSIFNSLQINNEYVGQFYATNFTLDEGEYYSTTINLCGMSADSFYLKFESTGDFEYAMQWYPVNVYNRDDLFYLFNNTPVTASSFSFNTEEEASLGYEFWGNPNFDTVDYFTTILPAANYDSVYLRIKAQNNQCSGTQWIKYFCYQNGSSTPFASGFVGDNPAVSSFQQVFSSIPLNNMQEGDTLLVKFVTNGTFGYQFIYRYQDIYDDEEDNCCLYNAIVLNEGVIKGGNVGEYDYNADQYIDEYDTYRIILPADGAMKFFVEARNDQCTQSSNSLLGTMLDKYGNFLDNFYLSQWPVAFPCGQLQYDTVKVRGYAADTFYIQLSAGEKVSYTLKYEFMDSTVSDSAESYNSPISTFIPIAESQVKKGHIRFKKTASLPDASDIYQYNMPGDGSITVYLKATYRGDFTSTNSSTSNRLTFVTSNFTDRTPSNPPTTTLTPDAVYLDTFVVCGLGAGNNFFTISSSRAYEYEVYYVVNNAITVQNDPEPNNFFLHAIPIVPNELRAGRLRYFNDMQGASQDNFDYYKTTTAYPGRLKVYIQATNTTCTTAARITLNMYKDTVSAGLIASRNLTNTTSIPAGATVYDTIYTCRFNADTAYMRLEGTQAFRYQFRFEFLADTTPDVDVEPDNTFAEARFIGQGQKREGVVGLIYNNVTDGNDYNKIAITTPGLLTIYFKAQNISCTDNRIFGVWGYRNTVNSYIFLKRYVLNAVGTIDAGQVVEDSIIYNVPATTDTVFIRIEGNGVFKYEFRIKPMTPTSSFSLVGDTTPCIGPVYTYKAVNVFNDSVAYNWSLPQGGGTLTYTDSIATVVWNENANRKIQLFLSNQFGSSDTKQLNVIINGVAPTQTPVAYNFARNLSTNSLPPGATCQWYRNDTLIAGVVDSTYYASLAGTYTVKFVNDCGPGPASNAISFAGDAQPQTISFPHVPTMTMSPTAKAALGATASSGLPVIYQKISGPGTIINDTLFITGVGTIIVKASQPGDDEYSAAAPVNDTITVVKGNQVITFDSIPPQIFNSTKLILTASSSMGQTISYSIVAGTEYASVNGNQLTKKGTGLVTVRASQNGNGNYNAAVAVERTFCIGVRTLTPIAGDAAPCLNTYRYNTQKIPGALYEWTLSGGGILTVNNDTAWVQWQTPGAYTLSVKANGTCDTVHTDEQVLNITISNNVPGMVSGMLPADGIVNQQLPLRLSWIPGMNTVNYDLYIWDSAATEPLTPYVTNIADISFTIPKNAPFPYNRTYKWKVVAKNPCAQTAGLVQTFRLIPLPDLVISDIQAPPTATSGQTITISWKVTNIGPGRTLLDQSWEDGIYFALDTVPNVDLGNPFAFSSSWSQLTAAGRPLLLGRKNRPASLDSGQFYINSINFTLPLGYNFPVYVYGIAANNGAIYRLLQASNLNDTARAPNQVVITQPPVPDLRVDSVFTPASIFSGSNVSITYKVKNYGVVTPAGGHWVDSFFISQNPLFDRNQCILLNAPKQNGSYYPNASGAAVSNNTQLNVDSTVTRNVQVVIPNFIFGTWFIYVKTNAGTTTGNYIYEGALNNNNINQAQVQVYLTPTPKLTINSLTIPVTTASTTQPIGVNWEIKNEGFRDNIEKNRGHFITMGTCHIPCPSGSPPNTICIGSSVQRDSVVFGSSYWIDRVYLSADSSGLNLANAILMKEVKHGIQNSGVYPDPLFPNTSFVSCPALVGGNINVGNIIEPGVSFPKAEGFTVPSNLVPGDYYIYVYTNPTKTVFEYPGTPQIRRSALPISVQRPDVVVSAISAPASAFGGQTVTLSYNILNNGPGGVFNHQRRDRYYISNFSNFDGSAQLIGSQTFTGNLPVGTPVPYTFNYTLPPATTGAKYFFVETNYDSLFKETNSTNNISLSAGTLITAASPADLIVSIVQPQDSVLIQSPALFKYTVINNGSGATIGNWTDSLFISCSPVFNASTAKFVTKRSQTRVLQAGSNYTDSFLYVIPKMSYEINSCFPQQMYAPGYFFVKTNADNGAFEGAATTNNTAASGSRVIINPLVDHVMISTSVNRDTISFGTAFTAAWKVKNIGYKPVSEYYYFYDDGLYFSPDSAINANDVGIHSYRNYNTINRNDSLVTTRTVMPPDLPAGDYYVIAKTNYADRIPAEKIFTNNNGFVRNISGQAKKIHLVRPPLPDLVDTILSAPASVALGQPFTVIYKITNIGAAVTFPSAWQNDLRLSSDFQVQVGQHVLSNKTRNTPLIPGASFIDTVTCTMPLNIAPGNYVIIGRTNSNNAVPESSTTNNLGFRIIEAQLPDSTDLVVENILRPDTVYLGYTIDTAKWVIKNNSGVSIRGWVTDGIYLSAGNLLDSTATLLGTKKRIIDLLPMETDSVKLTPEVTTAAEGHYNLHVKTDLLNNIIELDKTNNSGVTITPIYVKAKELKLGIPELNTLQTINRYYKLQIPDSLRGATILVTLKTNDSLLLRNEMYIGGGFVPTPANYDYRFEIPNYGNQQIVLNDASDSVYYIMYRCVSVNPPLQNITLNAVVLPFAILNVHTSSGGNIGNVTVRIKGSLFRDSMIAKLSNGTTTIYASAVYYTNNTQVFATFPLQGKPLGIYNVTLIKPDSSIAVLPNGFSIVPANNGGLITGGGTNTGSGNGNAPGCDPGAASGLNSQLVVELIVPEKVVRGRPVVIVINFSNPTNFDLPVQSRILYNDEQEKMAFTKEGIPNGTPTLYLEFVEQGGPPGIIRPGGGGSIIVHCKAPPQVPADRSVLFKLQ